ncbi:MAG TPA: hypothetical protein VJ464_03015 [Blastocatellia bacterium]|nr:hypothetical protein [Blastocatellia bacterium]
MAMHNRIKALLGLVVLAVVVGAMTIPAAAQTGTHSLSISRQAKLAGQVIQPGKYNMTYDESKDGDLVVTKGGKEILKAAYKRVELTTVPADSAVVFVAAGDGGYKVRRIEIKGSKTALVFE